MRLKKKIRNIFFDMDKTLLFSTLLLIGFGALNIITASSREAVINAQAGMFYYFFKHIIILLISLAAFIIIINIDTKKYENLVPIAYFILVAANCLLIFKGGDTRGARNWISLPFFGSMQPSEFSKPVIIVMLSLLFQRSIKISKKKNSKDNGSMLGTIIFVGLSIPVLVFFQKDMGTAAILGGIFAVLFLSSPITKKDKLTALVAVIIVIILGLGILKFGSGRILTDAQMSRIKYFRDPCANYTGKGYQVCNAFIAINNGGVWGVGWGKSTQKYSYIPEPHTDMVFAIIVEEHGVVGGIIILLCYGIILFRIIKTSMKVSKISSKYICLGIATYIFLHIFINLGGLFGLIPLTGVPLPFLSYGGSFTLSLICSMGIVQRIHIEMKNEKIKI